MMRAITAACGVAVGLLAGFAIVFANPLYFVGRVPPLSGDSVSEARFHDGDAANPEGTVRGLLGFGRGGAWERDPALQTVRASIVRLPATGDEPPALAVRISTIADQNSPWRSRLGMLDHWLIARPGAGSFFAAGYNNFWAVTRDLGWGFVRGRSRAALAAEYDLSALPPASHASGIVGASGDFRGVSGEFRTALLPEANAGATWNLQFRFDQP